MRTETFVLQIDFDTDSVRSVLVDARNGELADVAVAPLQGWMQGLHGDPHARRDDWCFTTAIRPT